MKIPKIFISYSWTNEPHENRVLRLAEDLVQSGIEVILDKWHLKEGNDSYKFMEQMVTDASIDKVIIISDKGYTEKADKRVGGVGTESQILTPELYSDTKQTKFVVVSFEKDSNGNPFIPTFYKSRIHIDMSDASNEAISFERLVRHIFNKPINQPPQLGTPPSYITENDNSVQLLTRIPFARCVEAIKSSRSNAFASFAEYLNSLLGEVEKLRLIRTDEPFDDLVVESIKGFIPYRNEAITLFDIVCKYGTDEQYIDEIKSFFERFHAFSVKPKDISRFYETDWDNFKFIIHELFLYCVSVFIKNRKYTWVNKLLSSSYYVRFGPSGQFSMKPVSVFRSHIASLDEHRKQRLELNRRSLHADYLKEGCVGLPINFDELMQTDFILFLYCNIHQLDSWGWYPVSCIYSSGYETNFEIFIRSASSREFVGLCTILGVEDKKPLDEFIAATNTNPRILPQWGFHKLDVVSLMAYSKLATLP